MTDTNHFCFFIIDRFREVEEGDVRGEEGVGPPSGSFSVSRNNPRKKPGLPLPLLNLPRMGNL